MTSDRLTTLRANQKVHGALVASGEYQRSPHFRPENIRKVRGWVEALAAAIPDLREQRAIDFGCGTGFMIDRLRDLVGEVHGVDITIEMMKHVDTSSGNVHLHECLAEQTPFEAGSFALATAYSFMDHLHDVTDFLREVHRVLRPGGVFFSGLNPNRSFIRWMEQVAASGAAASHAVFGREIMGALRNGDHYEREFGIEGAELELAEPGKSVRRGFDPGEIMEQARDIGFARCEVWHDWFLGQGPLMHQRSFQSAEAVDGYLRDLLPVSASYFKYLNFTLYK